MDMPQMKKKLQRLFEVARTDASFREKLEKNPRKAIEESGLDLSDAETQATIDIVTGSSESSIAVSLEPQREEWAKIKGPKK
jgi:hypothetical protein